MNAPILMVDDRVENLVALETVLAELGEPLVRAASGEEALMRVLDQDFAVILLDVQMPGMDGFETASLIRQREKSRMTPIIFITASISQDEQYVFRGYSYGAVDYIFKPLSPPVLRAKVSVFVDLFKLARRLAAQAEELKRSNAELEQFAYVASHDLREPLRKIINFSQLIEQRYKGKLDEQADSYLTRVVEAAARMQTLITDLLEYSRAGKEHRPFEVLQSEALLERALENLGVVIQESQAVVTHDELPPVRGDATQLTELFQNLISNAIKFRGSRPPAVHVGARAEDGRWVFSVADNGIGIPPEYKESIFAVFKRLHRKEEYPGTGIGLAICKKVVEHHGGTIWVESELGRGSTFHFSLPKAA